MIRPTYKMERVILGVLWKKDSFWRDLMNSEGNAQMLAHEIYEKLKKEAKKDDSLYLDIY